MAAGLKRHVERCAGEVGVAAIGDRVHLGVRAPVTLVPTLAKNLAISGDHGTDLRIWADVADPSAAKLDCLG
jgi:hypothetical protein